MFRVFAWIALVLWVTTQGASARTGDDTFKAPDSIVLKNGRIVRGLILKNTSRDVLIQEQYGEFTYQKKDIARIRDEADTGMEYTDMQRKGSLPSWRVLANDLRTHDAIRSLEEIPATAIDVGVFRNVPYKSFRVNRDIELNIYGDPEHPAGLELGIYGFKAADTKLREILRGYLAGYLTTREELAVLYKLPLSGGLGHAGNLALEITPKTAPDAYGAWWISLYNTRLLDNTRLNDQTYRRMTHPMNEIVDKNGRLLSNEWTHEQMSMSTRLHQTPGNAARVLPRGFYRDADGTFRLIENEPAAR